MVSEEYKITIAILITLFLTVVFVTSQLTSCERHRIDVNKQIGVKTLPRMGGKIITFGRSKNNE
jgi:UDP-N-acetylmuramyl pentapeptide phosphotransferase/UDP-N-acetylglucosamine-1-phosphate transferase